MRFASLLATASLSFAFALGTAQVASAASGSFHDGPHAPDHRVKGTAEIVETASGGYELRLGADFVSDAGPDVVIALSTAPDAKDDATVVNSELLNLGPRKALTGAQSYPLPAGVDDEKWKSVVVWCKQYSVQFGVAPLKE